MDGCNGTCWSAQSESFDQAHEVYRQPTPLSPVSPTFPDETNQSLSPIALDPLPQRAQGKLVHRSHTGKRDATFQEWLDQGKALQRLFPLRLGSACKLGEMFGHCSLLFRQLAGERCTWSTRLSPPRYGSRRYWSVVVLGCVLCFFAHTGGRGRAAAAPSPASARNAPAQGEDPKSDGGQRTQAQHEHVAAQ